MRNIFRGLVVIGAVLGVSGGLSHGDGTTPITITAVPGLPAVELIRNGGFELPYTAQPVLPDQWRSWLSRTRKSPPNAWRDTAALHGGTASLRMDTIPGLSRRQQGVYQRIDAEQIAPDVPYCLAFWGRVSEGGGDGVVEVMALVGARYVPIAECRFRGADWQRYSFEFKAPPAPTAVFVCIGPAEDAGAATIWMDDVSLLPLQTIVEYGAAIPELRRVRLVDEKGAVLQDSGLLYGTAHEYAHTATVSTLGRYRIEAVDGRGNTIARDYPDARKLASGNLLVNGDFEEPPAPAEPCLPEGWTIKRGLTMPAHAVLDTQEYKSGKQSFRMESTGLSWQAIVQQVPFNAWQPNQLYLCVFWGKTGSDGTGAVTVEDLTQRKELGGIRFSSEEWKLYSFTFTMPPAERDVIVCLKVASFRVEDTVVWWDKAVVRPLRADEHALYGRVAGMIRDVDDIYRATVRAGYYDAETQVDLLGIDADELRAFGILDDAAARALDRHIEALRMRLQDGARRFTGDKDHAIETLEGLLVLAETDKREAILEGVVGWRGQWTQAASSEYGAIIEACRKLRKELEPQLAALAGAKRDKDLEISAREAAAFPGDFRQAIHQIASEDPAIRERGALELGRLENPEAVPALIALLQDSAYPVRRNALYALAWIRADAAVPEIAALAETHPDAWTRRRATQALGMIGSSKASPTLFKLAEDQDGAVRQNALMGLGWLRETKAVPLLADIVSRYRNEFLAVTNTPPWLFIVVNGPQHTAAAAIYALGLIGDKRVAPLLVDVMHSQSDRQREMHTELASLMARFALGQLGDTNVIAALEAQATHSRFWLWPQESRNALYLLNNPPPATALGIRQPDFLKEKRYFYWFGSRFHRGFGRWMTYPLAGDRPRDVAQAMRVMGAAHATESIEWSVPAPLDEARRYFESAAFNGLRAITAYRGRQGPFSKANLARLVHHYGRYPAFNALWGEESGMDVLMEDVRDFLPRYVASIYSAQEREQLGLQADRMAGFIEPNLCFVDVAKRRQERPGFAVYAEAMDANLFDGCRELVEFLHMLRKNMPIGHYSSIPANTFASCVNLASFGRMGHVFDYNGTQPSYSSVAYENAYLLEMCRDGRRYPTGTETYIWRLPRPLTRLWEAAIGLSLLHGQQMYVWYWGDIYKQLNNRERGRPAAWSITTNMFAKIEKIEPYLVNPGFPGDIGVIHSGRTAGLLYRDDERDRLKKETFQEGDYFFNNAGLFHALACEHIQSDVIWAETMTPAKIAGYKVLIVSDAKTLTPAEEQILRNWVRAGGTLIATGATSAFDQYGRERANYGLADVFGVAFKTNSSMGMLATTSDRRVPRGGRVQFSLDISNAPAAVARRLQPELAVEFRATADCDQVDAGPAQVLARWNNTRHPALTLNAFGQGHCFFLSAVAPGLMYANERVIYRYALLKQYFPGIRELLAGLVRSGLELAGGTPAFEVINCPHHVEAHVKTQPEHNRLLFQLLNYDERVMPISGVTARIRVPHAGPVRIFYPEDAQSVVFQREGEYVNFQVRPFEIHAAVVLEWALPGELR